MHLLVDETARGPRRELIVRMPDGRTYTADIPAALDPHQVIDQDERIICSLVAEDHWP